MKEPVNRIPLENPAHRAGSELQFRRRRLGFRPAFLDYATMHIHPSRFSDGRPAPFHSYEGLPEHLVRRAVAPFGRTIAVKDTLVAGFERDGFFYTYRTAERACGEWGKS